MLLNLGSSNNAFENHFQEFCLWILLQRWLPNIDVIGEQLKVLVNERCTKGHLWLHKFCRFLSNASLEEHFFSIFTSFFPALHLESFFENILTEHKTSNQSVKNLKWLKGESQSLKHPPTLASLDHVRNLLNIHSFITIQFLKMSRGFSSYNSSFKSFYSLLYSKNGIEIGKLSVGIRNEPNCCNGRSLLELPFEAKKVCLLVSLELQLTFHQNFPGENWTFDVWSLKKSLILLVPWCLFPSSDVAKLVWGKMFRSIGCFEILFEINNPVCPKFYHQELE